MKRFLMISLVPAVLLVLAATVLVARSDGAGGGDERHDTSAAELSATAAKTRARPGPTSTTRPTTTAPMAATAPADDPHFVCPDGGMHAVVALQQAWEDGHQPWLGSAPDVAAACTPGVPESLVEPSGPDSYQVTHTTATTNESAIVELAQPLGPGTVWVAVEITYTTSGTPLAPCTTASILPLVADELEAAAGGALHVAVDLQQCERADGSCDGHSPSRRVKPPESYGHRRQEQGCASPASAGQVWNRLVFCHPTCPVRRR